MTHIARRFLQTLEPIVTSVLMMPPEVTEEMSAIGIADPIAGYVTARAAPLGRVSAATATAVFYNWSPAVIERSLRFDLAEPEVVLGARGRAAARTHERLIGLDAPGLDDALALLRRVTDACRPEGRPLFAGNAALPWPEHPLEALWHGGNLLREFRGDGHIAVLVAHGLSGPAAFVMNMAYTRWSRDFFYGLRGWPEEVYRAAHEDLVARGFFSDAGDLTDAGLKFKEMIEVETDRAATAPLDALGADAGRLLELLAPLGERVYERKGLHPSSARIARVD